MFPDYLDNAKVLEYTDRGRYGFVIEYDENYVPHHKELHYLAIAQYDGDDRFYLFGCDADFEVMSDSLWDSPEGCKSGDCYVSEDTVWHKKINTPGHRTGFPNEEFLIPHS